MASQERQGIFSILFQVINYFTSKLEKVNSDLGENEVLATIQQGALQWPRERLKVTFLFKERGVICLYFNSRTVTDIILLPILEIS